MLSECITVRPNDCLKGVRREWHTRKKGCYLLEDKHGTYLVVAQKLHLLASFLNTIAQDASSRVSLTALHEIVNTSDNRVGGWLKYRWRVRFAPLEEVGGLFERRRPSFEQSLILGQPECYRLEGA